jgi:hypothetical protein
MYICDENLPIEILIERILKAKADAVFYAFEGAGPKL